MGSHEIYGSAMGPQSTLRSSRALPQMNELDGRHIYFDVKSSLIKVPEKTTEIREGFIAHFVREVVENISTVLLVRPHLRILLILPLQRIQFYFNSSFAPERRTADLRASFALIVRGSSGPALRSKPLTAAILLRIFLFVTL